MKVKNNRLEALRLIISSQQLGSQDELLTALQKEGFKLTRFHEWQIRVCIT